MVYNQNEQSDQPTSWVDSALNFLTDKVNDMGHFINDIGSNIIDSIGSGLDDAGEADAASREIATAQINQQAASIAQDNDNSSALIDGSLNDTALELARTNSGAFQTMMQEINQATDSVAQKNNGNTAVVTDTTHNTTSQAQATVTQNQSVTTNWFDGAFSGLNSGIAALGAWAEEHLRDILSFPLVAFFNTIRDFFFEKVE